MGTYGGQGYDVIDGSSSLPSYATVTPSGANSYVWAPSTTDSRALQTMGSSSRIAATWWTTTSFAVDVNLTDGQAFFPTGGGERFLRLPFCALSPAEIDDGIQRLAASVRAVR